MTANHPSRSYKGCALCKPNKRKGQSQRKFPWAAQKQLGQKRRLTQIEAE